MENIHPESIVSHAYKYASSITPEALNELMAGYIVGSTVPALRQVPYQGNKISHFRYSDYTNISSCSICKSIRHIVVTFTNNEFMFFCCQIGTLELGIVDPNYRTKIQLLNRETPKKSRWESIEV